MSLRAHILLLVLTVTFVGMAMTLASHRWHTRIELLRASLSQDSVSRVQLENIEASYERFLVTFDLVSYSGVTYLASDAQEQLTAFTTQISNFSNSAVVSFSAASEGAIQSHLAPARELLQAASAGDPAGLDPSQLEIVDEHLDQVLRILETIERDAREQTQQAEARLARETRTRASAQFAGSFAYVVFVVVLVAWTTRRIGRPVAALADLADLAERGVESSVLPLLDESGPAEFKTISKNVRKLVDSLEETVQERTASLAQRIQENLETHASLEESNTRLQATVAELRRAELALVQRAKLAVLGEMVGGMAHDFNNLLVPIISYGEILLEDSRMSEQQRQEMLKIIMSAAADAVAIIRRLQEFSRSPVQQSRLIDIDLNQTVQDAIAMVEPRFKTRTRAGTNEVTVEVNLGAMPVFRGSLAEIRQSTVNLIVNAADAMPDGGRLAISTHADDQNVCIEIRDTGMGMSREVLARCRDPFFSTKEEKGTGLGLAMVNKMAFDHGGRLEIESQLGEGTRILLVLPRTRSDEPLEVASGQTDGSLSGTRVLLIDDEEVVLRSTSETLTRMGCFVTSSQQPLEAIQAHQDNPFDVIITDLRMKGLSGIDVARRVSLQQDRCPVLLLTGHSGAVTQAEDLEFIEGIVEKPVTGAALRAALLQALNPAKGG